MFLIKCSCGCVATVKNVSDRSNYHITCQSCGKSVSFYNNIEICELSQSIKESGIEIRVIPDDAKITVSFDT